MNQNKKESPKSPQKNFESTGLFKDSSLFVSYNRLSFPSLSIYLLHFKPTKTLPRTFLVNQKSIAARSVTQVNLITKEFGKNTEKKYKAIGVPLKIKSQVIRPG